MGSQTPRHMLWFLDTPGPHANTKFRTRVIEAGGDPKLVKDKPPAIVFGIARNSDKSFTAECQARRRITHSSLSRVWLVQ